MNSPVRLGVSPAQPPASTPTGVLNQRFEALFPHAGALGCVVCFAPQLFLPVYSHVNVELPGPAAAASASCSLPASCSLAGPCPPATPHKSSLTGCPAPPLLSVWMNVSSLSPWLSDFHTVQFSVSSGCFLFLNCCPSFGCARRHSVSIYASILAGSHTTVFEQHYKPGSLCTSTHIHHE